MDLLKKEESPGCHPCSRKGCSSLAAWKVLWNNPRIHSAQRRKTWLACPEHRQFLEEFLQARGFWKETLPFEDLEQEDRPGQDKMR
ncbi:MAG: hypothetical protein Q4C74_01095 [Rothia sp. (in: high G+C Gram-positive bacteria)]|nr:hypothetical protein [Rothia sp. (in: high G+C Gram-positive bacteria)]